MLGLLIKDIRLMMGQMRFFLTIVLIACFLMVTGENAEFVVSYCTMIFTFFSISTLSYDEMNHGMSFLFTLPVSRKGYVLEKYVFGLGLGGFAWIATTLLGGIYSMTKIDAFVWGDWLAGALGIFVVLCIFLGVLLPMQFKYGAEKGRTAMFIFMGAVFAVVMAVAKIEGLEEWLGNRLILLQSVGTATIVLLGVAFLIALMVASMCLSIRFVEKKQF